MPPADQPKRMAKGSSPNIRKNRIAQQAERWKTIIDFPFFFLAFSKLCLIGEAKIIALSDMILKMYRGNYTIIFLNEESKGM